MSLNPKREGLPLHYDVITILILCDSIQVLSEGLQRVLVLEDDIDFEPQFRKGVVELMEEAEAFTPTWDLM